MANVVTWASMAPDARPGRVAPHHACVTNVRSRSALGASRAGCVQVSRFADERLERLLVDLVTLVEVDRPPDVALEARVEQARGVFERGALGERQLHDALVRLAGADDAVA